MKYPLLFIFVVALLPTILLSTNGGHASDVDVYICRSKSSYAYHNRLCQGLRNCKHKIDTVTTEIAIKTLRKKACGYCYR